MPILNLKVEDTQKVIVKPDQITVTYTATTYNFIGSGATSVVVDDRDVTIYTNPSGVNIVGSGATDVSIINNEWVIHTPEVDVPTLTSELTNDSGFITISDVPVIPTNVSEFTNDAGYITISDIPEEKTLIGSGDTVVTLSGSTWIINTTVPDSAAWGNITGTLANQTDLQQALDAKANQVDFTEHTGDTSIHYPMSGITITESQISDLGSYATQTDLTTHTGDTDIHYPMSGITIDYSQLTNTPTIPVVPTNVSDFTNDAGYITISDVPVIPTTLSAFTNDVGYVTGLTWSEVTDKPSLTLQNDFTGHTSDTSIHYPMSGISINVDQISNFPTFTGSGDTTVTLSGDTYVVYTPTGETGSESLSGLTDVTLTSPQNYDTLIYSGSTWINKKSIDIESNVSDGDLLQRSGSTIVGYNIPDLSIYALQSDLGDYTLTGTTAQLQSDFTAHTGDTSIHYAMSAITITESQINDFGSYTLTGTTAQLQSDFTAHTGDTSIHYPMSGISITESQISNFGDYTTTGTTAQLQSDFTTHTGDTDIHYEMSGITITESQISDLQNYALQSTVTGLTSNFNSHTGNTAIHYEMSGITITRSQVSDFITIQGSGDTTVTLSGDTYVVHSEGGGGGSTSLSGLTDTLISTPTSGDTLMYSGTTWINQESISIDNNVSDGDLLQVSGSTIQGFTIGSIASYDVWTGTQAQYDALGSYSSTTIYLIEEA